VVIHRQNADLVRQTLERIECNFTYVQHGSQTRSKLTKVVFVPLVKPESGIRWLMTTARGLAKV